MKQSLPTPEQRALEVAKYHRAYADPRYAMGEQRRYQAIAMLASLPVRGPYLDVGCGRGEMLDEAKSLGFDPMWGVDPVQLQHTPFGSVHEPIVLADHAHDLPFKNQTINVATMFDVMEHLLPGDDEAACRELRRVAVHYVLLTISNRESIKNGDVLHINRRSYDVWHGMLCRWFTGCRVERVDDEFNQPVSAAWRITL